MFYPAILGTFLEHLLRTRHKGCGDAWRKNAIPSCISEVQALMQEMKRKQLWFRMIREAIDVTASLEALGWGGGLLTPSWEVLAMCMIVPECAQAGPSEGRREGRDLQRLPEEVVGDTLFLLLLLSLWRPSLDYHSWALASPLFISQGRTDDLADAEFRRGNRGSVTQPFPGGDPSVLLLRAINFIEAGLCREGAARGWVS